MLITRLLAYGVAASILAGCAVGRGTVDVAAPKSANPATGKYVRIDSVSDKRTFEAAPATADIASLDPDEDTSDASKSRAIGRKRNSYGKALGDIVLPEGKTVSSVVEEALTSGFQDAGYIVVKKGDPNYDAAAPVNASIVNFWAWFQPGFWAISVNHKSEVQLAGQIDRLNGHETITTKVTESRQMASSSEWKEIVEKGLAAISEQTTKLLTK